MILGFYWLKAKNRDVETAKLSMDSEDSFETINAGDGREIEVQDDLDAWEVESPNVLAQTENYIIKKVTENQALTIDTLSLDQAVYDGNTPITIKGAVAPGVQSITVEFSNLSSNFNNDSYDLQEFKDWDTSFEYNASPKFEVLDAWENTYLFTASTREWDSITELTIISQWWESSDEEKISWEAQEEVTQNWSITDVDFPKWDFWEVIISNSTTAYYSDIKWLEIKKEANLSAVSCATVEKEIEVEVESTGTGADEVSTETQTETSYILTDYLVEKYGFVYWNTCRPLVNTDFWVSFFVVRLEWDDYLYEKHYIDYKNGLHGILELETGTWVTRENMSEKNTEFRDKSFPILSVSDSLFQTIIRDNS